MKKTRDSQIRIGELAKAAGVTVPTVKHYLQAGLIPRPRKTGRTMAYYDRSCVARIKLIKKLQREKYLPLEVIRRVLDSGPGRRRELELGQAIFKSQKFGALEQPVSEARIEKAVGYPLRKIALLEKHSLLAPFIEDGQKYYDAIDCKIIELFKIREELELPLEYSLETVSGYRDAVKTAVERDIRLFAQGMLGDVPVDKAVKFMTEADQTLDSFMVLYRRKLIRSFSRDAFREINELSERLSQLIFLPVPGRELPESLPGGLRLQVVDLLLQGDFISALGLLKSKEAQRQKAFSAPALVIAHILAGDYKTALEIAERRIPQSGARALDDLSAALACMFAVGPASGFSRPVQLLKKGLGRLKRIEQGRDDRSLETLFGRFICAGIYSMLPEIFNTRQKGVSMLLELAPAFQKRSAKTGPMPGWLKRTLDSEIFPAIELKINRLLAEAYLRDRDRAKARTRLQRVAALSRPESPDSKWARLELMGRKK